MRLTNFESCTPYEGTLPYPMSEHLPFSENARHLYIHRPVRSTPCSLYCPCQPLTI